MDSTDVTKCDLEEVGAHLEEGHAGAAEDGAVLDLGLAREVVGRLDVHRHPLDGEKGGQVGGVGRDDDESEEPPDGADEARGGGAWHQVTTWQHGGIGP